MVYLARIWRVESDETKSDTAAALLSRLPAAVATVLPFQVLGEAYHVMRRHSYTPEQCRVIANDWTDNFEMFGSSASAFQDALVLATEHRLQFWDALIISVAVEARCALLLSEDMQAGFAWKGLTIVNPFADALDPQLARLLDVAE